MAVSIALITDPFLVRAAQAIQADDQVNQLIEKVIDPFKIEFRQTIDTKGQGYTLDVPGVGRVKGALGTLAKTETTYYADISKIEPELLKKLQATGAVFKKTTVRKASAHRVSFEINT
jgi:hypothetical protein